MAKGVSKKKSSKAKSKSQKKKSVTKKKVKPIKKKAISRPSKKAVSDRDEFSDEEQKFNQEPPADGNGFSHEEPTEFNAEREYDRRSGDDDDDEREDDYPADTEY